MSIDFHAQKNRYTYATREADSSWMTMVNTIVAVGGKRVLDIGCGEGIYTKALADMRAASVTSLDPSREMLQRARENCGGCSHITLGPSGPPRTAHRRARAHHIRQQPHLHPP